MKAKKARIGRPPLAPDTTLYSLRLPASLMRKVDAMAKAAGVTRSEALRSIIAAGLKGGRHGR
jgi:metal-responsive CopG/Arc/MetJ family transcriptional regulator